jgi:hypothetical protein
MTEPQDPNRNYKVGEILAEYGLLDLHDKLSKLWLGENGEKVSLRNLAERINIALVRRSLEEAGEEPLEGEAENTYRLLSSDEVSSGVRVQQRNQLQRAGIDVNQLENDFVTHQAVHTYLTKGLGISKDTSTDTDPVETHKERIQRLRSRMNAVLGQSVSELRTTGELSTGQLDTTVNLQAYCQDCENQYDAIELLEKGGCGCDQ